MAKAPVTAKTAEIQILEITQDAMTVHVIGTTPLICHSKSKQLKEYLLLPGGRKTEAEKASSLKHDPLQEFRDSMTKDGSPNGPTRVMMPASALKGAMMQAAVDLPGPKKAEIGRLVTVIGERVPIWGIPLMKMDVVRSADIAKTPDVRTRACLLEWATVLHLQFVVPKLTGQGLMNLVAAGGVTSGIGDFRQQKGAGSFGLFQAVNADNPDFLRIVETGARAAQDAAIENPSFYDSETEELYTWYVEEVLRRGRAPNKPKLLKQAA